jgi:hypothetical protein
MSGYIYVLIRGDFIEQKRYVYKIGRTDRFPPHKRLWDYPYGSLFLTLIKTNQSVAFEKQLKQQLSHSSQIHCEKDIGAEYYSGSFSCLIEILRKICSVRNILVVEQKLSEDHLLYLNRVNYLVNYDETYFAPIYQVIIPYTNEPIETKVIYESYQQFLSWHANGYPDTYVIRSGKVSIKPIRPVIYHGSDTIRASSSGVNGDLRPPS